LGRGLAYRASSSTAPTRGALRVGDVDFPIDYEGGETMIARAAIDAAVGRLAAALEAVDEVRERCRGGNDVLAAMRLFSVRAETLLNPAMRRFAEPSDGARSVDPLLTMRSERQSLATGSENGLSRPFCPWRTCHS
jgi:hypothetical protein